MVRNAFQIIAFTVLLALACGNGLHLAALQTVGWATMLAESVKSKPLGTAISETFDGKHPCPLCRVVARSSETNKEQLPKMFPGFELRAILATRAVVPEPDFEPFAHPVYLSASAHFVPKPPTPPPRSA